MKAKLIVILALILLGCYKHKPGEGSRLAVFTYDNGNTKSGDVEISEVTKNSFKIDGSKVSKNGKKIKGTVFLLFASDPYEIEGKLSYSGSIEGNFKQTANYLNGQSYALSGTFKIHNSQ